MKSIFTTLFAVVLTVSAFAQSTVSGIVQDKDTGERLIGASLLVVGTNSGTITNIDGEFQLTIPEGKGVIEVSYIGYLSREILVEGKTDLGNIELESDAVGLDAIQVVASVAIDRKTPVAVSTLTAEQVETKLGNQEFPELLKSTPSIYTTKQGGGAGDARINVRGFSQENVALLINGISVSGMEDNKVYWSNWAGLGDVTRTIQIQRGLGASRLAISSVGGTINIITKTTDQVKGGSVFTAIGNDGYQKSGLTLSTGRTDNGWAFTVSGSRTTGDGYITGTYNDAWSYFGSVAKEIGSNQQLLFTIIGAPQRHGQRDFWHSIDDQQGKYGTKWNDDFGYYQGQDFNWRENFYHKPQASLNHIWEVNEGTSLVTAAYASTGRGGGTGDIGSKREFQIPRNTYGENDFDQIANWNAGRDNTLGLTPFPSYNYIPGGTSDTLSARVVSPNGGGIIKRASMNEHQWYGVLSTLTTELSENLTLSGGVDLRFYTGSHYRKTIDLLGGELYFDDDNSNYKPDWVDFNEDGIQDANEMGNLIRPTNDAADLFGAVPAEERIDYYNDEDINWYGLFAQLEYSTGDLSAFLSGAFNNTQMRRIDFFNKPESSNTTDWLSFNGGNVKLGANYNIDRNNNVFVNLGYVSRSPYFDALFPTFSNDAPNTDAAGEQVLAAEIGYGYRSNGFSANLNGYYTDWSNKTEVSSFFDDNGDVYFLNLLGVDALHMGVELDFKVKVSNEFNITGFAGLNDWQWKNDPSGVVSDENQNVIGEKNFFLDGLKVGGSAQTTVGAGFNWQIVNGLSLNGQWFYFDNLYASYNPDDRDDADLTGVQALELPSYALTDLGLVWNFKFAGLDSRLNVNVNNLFDKEYIAEAADRYRDGQTSEQLLYDTRGWYGFGRTWNAGLKVNF